jgi:hypothetical protein
MNKNWFQIGIEHDDEDPEILHHVLHTSPVGLARLIADLTIVHEKHEIGRFTLDTHDYDSNYDIPYKFIELSESPENSAQDSNDSNWGCYFGALGIGLAALLAIYGAYSLATRFL